jgi:hypothetical protein
MQMRKFNGLYEQRFDGRRYKKEQNVSYGRCREVNKIRMALGFVYKFKGVLQGGGEQQCTVKSVRFLISMQPRLSTRILLAGIPQLIYGLFEVAHEQVSPTEMRDLIETKTLSAGLLSSTAEPETP